MIAAALCIAALTVGDGAEIVAIVRDHFYDPARAKAWADANAHYADSSADPDDFAARTRVVLARLKASHTAFYTPDNLEYHALLAIFGASLKLPVQPIETIGVDLAPGNFVRHTFPNVVDSRLKRGDKILAADGQPFHPLRSLRGRAGKPVVLSVQRKADAEPFELTVTPRSIDPKAYFLAIQAFEPGGSRIINVGRKKIAYMHLFSGAGDEHADALKAAIAGPFAEADALVLDVRDGWGGCNPDFVNIFSHAPPLLESIDRTGQHRRHDTQWRKPFVLLVNSGSRSGKEVLAHAVQSQKLGKIVGTPTAGAVLAGRPFPLKDGNLLYLAVADVLVDGRRLEGKGITPDVELADVLPFADGGDAQLDRALQEAAK
jgi:carboxyl-terminal processing protease